MYGGRLLATYRNVGSRLSGLAVSLSGLGFVGAGVFARRDVMRVLVQERIVNPEDERPVEDAAGARAMAELIRRHTLESTGGRTYAETDEGPERDLWIQSTTLQTALTQAYMAFRLAELTIALGAVLVATGIGLAAAGRDRDP